MDLSGVNTNFTQHTIEFLNTSECSVDLTRMVFDFIRIPKIVYARDEIVPEWVVRVEQGDEVFLVGLLLLCSPLPRFEVCDLFL